MIIGIFLLDKSLLPHLHGLLTPIYVERLVGSPLNF